MQVDLYNGGKMGVWGVCIWLDYVLNKMYILTV